MPICSPLKEQLDVPPQTSPSVDRSASSTRCLRLRTIAFAYLVARRWPQRRSLPALRQSQGLCACFRPSLAMCAMRAGGHGYRFSHLTGTIFENTNKPLKDWYRVAHLMLVSKKGMSALQIFRYMGFGSYKTAWLMCHKIRTALVEDIKKLGGIVEVDETYVGGSDKNRHWDKKSGSSAVVAILARLPSSARFAARAMSLLASLRTLKAATLEAFVRESVSHQRQSALHRCLVRDTRGLQSMDIPHRSVDHTRSSICRRRRSHKHD